LSRLRPDIESAAARRERTLRAWQHLTHDRSDPVERWKRVALGRAVDAGGVAVDRRVELRVGLGFTLTAALAGLPFGRGGPVLTLIGLTLVVLVDELPRVLLLRAWGRSSSVVLGSGGAVTESFGRRLDAGRAALASLSGPPANVLLSLGLVALSRRLPASLAGYVWTLALWHGVWGAAQALPFPPFRVGNALAARVRAPFPAVLTVFSAKFLLLGGLVLSKIFPSAFPLAILGAARALHDFFAIYVTALDAKRGLPGEARLAERLLDTGEPARAMALARRALGRCRSPELRARLWRTVAWGAIGEGDALVAHGAVGALPARELDVHLVAAYLAACNRADEAVALLEQARERGQRAPQTTKLLLELLLRRGELARGRAVAREDAALLSHDELRAIAASALGPASAG